MATKRTREDPGVMSLGLFALVAFLLVGTLAAVLGRDAGVDPDPIPFTVPDSAEGEGELQHTGDLPSEITESSGVARSRYDPELWYTHNDGDDGRVFAFREDGTLVSTWRLTGVAIIDTEDIASGPCPSGADSACLYIADTGDNDRDRSSYAVYVVREPDPASAEDGGDLEVIATVSYTYGGGSRDAEALAVLPDGSLIVVTKGQEGAAEVFRLPAPGGGEGAAAESLAVLPIDVEQLENRVTSAAVSPAGDRLAVRSDVALDLFEIPGFQPITRCTFDAGGLPGEAVDFIDQTMVLMTFEVPETGGSAPIVRARCG